MRDIYFIKPEDGECIKRKETVGRRTKKHSWLQETEAKSGESNKIPKTKHACIVEAHESTRQHLESSLPTDHEDHIAGKGYNSMIRYNLVHKFIPMPQAMKIPDAKEAVDKEGKQLETILAWQLDKVNSKKEVIVEAQRQTESPLCYIDGYLSPQECRVRTKKSEVQRKSGAPILAMSRHGEVSRVEAH